LTAIGVVLVVTVNGLDLFGIFDFFYSFVFDIILFYIFFVNFPPFKSIGNQNQSGKSNVKIKKQVLLFLLN